MTRRKLCLTRITPDVVSDPDKLGEVLDRILVGDPGLRRNHRKLVRQQNALRNAVNERQWAMFMLLEELFNDRLAMALDVVARQFYAAGRLARGRRK